MFLRCLRPATAKSQPVTGFDRRRQSSHAADSKLLAVRRRDAVRGHLQIAPAEHRHHLAFGGSAQAVTSAYALRTMAALLRFVDADKYSVLLQLHCPCLVHRQHTAFQSLAGEDLGANDPGRSSCPWCFPKT